MTLSGLLSEIRELSSFARLRDALATAQPVAPLELEAGLQPAFVAALKGSLERPVLLITGKPDSAGRWVQALETWLPTDQRPLRFPEPTPLPYERGPWSRRSRVGRLAVLAELSRSDGRPAIVVASARALMQRTLPPRRFKALSSMLKVGELIALEETLERWRLAGYEQVPVVSAAGQFSRRGGIFDLFPVGAEWPTRIELFGSEIETMRSFDTESQRSFGQPFKAGSRLMIPPAREAPPRELRRIGEKLLTSIEPRQDGLPSWRDDIPLMADGQSIANAEYFLPMAHSSPATLLNYLADDALVFVDDQRLLTEAAVELHDHADSIASEQEELPPDYRNPLISLDELQQLLASRNSTILGRSEDQDGEGSEFAADFIAGPRYGGQINPFIQHLMDARGSSERVVVVSQQAHRLAQLWRDELKRIEGGRAIEQIAVASGLESPPASEVTFVHGSVAEGFVLAPWVESTGRRSGALSLLADAEIFGWKRPVPSRRPRKAAKAPENTFTDIVVGDFVVHVDHGVGRFTGLVCRSVGGPEREYLQVEYAEGDTVYVPAHHADRLSKWIGPDDRGPRINRLGGQRWRTAKEKAREAVNEMAGELLELYAARQDVHGHVFAQDTEWQGELEAGFPYRETEDQLRAIDEVKGDMERPFPMDRLICGDVGYGKTEVALRASFKAVMDSKQVAILVPTTVLAQQHYHTFTRRLRTFPVNVEMLSRFRSVAHQEKIVRQMRNGEADIIIGTHRLLSDDVSFKDLGLVIVDEEQRFGVAHKEILKQLRTEVDVLTMTATPIPRTLYMSLSGVRDVSIIDTAPADRLPVQTYVGNSDDRLVHRVILREMERGGQVYYVHNKVQSIGIVLRQLRNRVPGARIELGHGQMKEKELSEVMGRFAQGEIDVLVCTTIIESGLDIPNANTLIVDRADQFGLSQMYQLRGRVGRGSRRAYAFFFHRPWRLLSREAKARLEAIASQTDLGGGMAIAMRDLEIRGAGELLGARQSGHVAAVGFEFYTRLLRQAVQQLRAEKEGMKLAPVSTDTVYIDLPLDAYVPTDYIPDGALRLRLYRRMATVATLAEVDNLAEELADRFGPVPDPVENLMYQLRVKVLAAKAGTDSITTENGQVRTRIPALPDSWDGYRLQRFLGEGVKVSRSSIWLGRRMATRQWQIALVQMLERIAELHVDDKLQNDKKG